MNFIKKYETNEVIYYMPIRYYSDEFKETTIPDNDKLYYQKLELEIAHLLYKYDHRWITSERQLCIADGSECITLIHLVPKEKEKMDMNVYCRSTNIKQIDDDIQFLEYICKKYGIDKLYIDFAMPHEFIGKNNKLGE